MWVISLGCRAEIAASGTLAQDTTWRAADSPVVVNADVVVPGGVTLRIEPGVIVYMGQGANLIVQGGVLHASGSAQNPIRVTALAVRQGGTGAKGSWGSWVIQAGGSASRIEHAVLEYGKGLAINGAAPQLNHVHLRAHQGAAIRLDSNASPVGVGNLAEDNDLNAVLVPAGVISGSVTWGLRGIPYLLQSGTISVGTPPVAQNLAPASVLVGQTATVTLTGQRLNGLTRPRFSRNGVSAEVVGTPGAGSAMIRVTAAADAETGLAAFSALTDAGEVTLADALDVLPLQPVLSALTPARIDVAQGPAEIVLTGQRFAATSAVLLNGDLIPTRFVSETQLAATVPNQSQVASLSLRVRTENLARPGTYFVSNEALLGVSANKLSLSPATADLVTGTQHTLTLRLAHPAPAGGVEIDLASSNPEVLKVPSPVVFTAGVQQVDVTAAALAPGRASVTASRSGFVSAAANAVVVAPPRLDIEPMPLAIPPDAVSRPFKLKLSRADTVTHTFQLASANTAIAEVTPAQLVLEAGQTQLTASIKGKTAGQTKIVITSPNLATVEVPVFVTADYRALSVSFAPALGVVVSQAPEPAAAVPVGPVASRLLGVSFGAGFSSLSPDRLTVGESQWLTLHGAGLGDVRSITLAPVAGVTIGVPEPAADGKSVRVQVAVAADAEAGLRRITVTDGQGRLLPGTPAAERLLITRPLPQVHSIAPLHALPGQNLTLTVRGNHLQGVTALRFSPGTDLVIDGSPVIASDGSSMTFNVQVGSAAMTGTHTLTVTTAAGTSSELAGPNNTFSVVGRVDQTLGPIVSGVLGVRVGAAGDPGTPVGTHAFARELGVVWGSGISAVSPRVGVTGSTFTLRLSGSGLAGVTAVQLAPNDGVTLGSLSASADGTRIEIPVTVAADAALTLRELRVTAGDTPVRFGSAGLERLQIVAPLPVVESVTPNHLLLGADPVTLTVRGRNLASASAVRLQPADGLSISPPLVDGEGRSLTVTVAAAAGAQPGERALLVTTPAGESDGVMTVANRVTLGTQVVASISPIVSPVLGVRVGADTGAQPFDGLLLAQPVGVRVGDAGVPGPIERTVPAQAPLLGISVGAVINAVGELRGFVPGARGTLTYAGYDLQVVEGVTLSPPDGVIPGAITVAADGRSLSLPIDVAADALPGTRVITFRTGDGPVPVVGPVMPHIRISEGVPVLTSMSPIVLKQGEAISLVFRGTRLRLVEGLRFTPDAGVVLDAAPQWATDAFGEKLTMPVRVAADAVLGARVVQLQVPGGESDGTAGPANTLTIIAP
ncbi:IPT/TIG domain-containing protein [Chitiniphilus purpureus]|uniref:IPT/TIG domain-containing protein n=1 Tax=Chitiniphilus purpureus TaxID=2981137 RepID=A0ABY6DLJ4_9NEIS|nr:IPT/TIG domain-containing protein [Chitiniphilus sp. CD1]UXY15232.1 IPT/TIG domain-containing protein [Chitiniphilus sp. CD1]